MNVIKHRIILVGIAGILMLGSVIALLGFGLKPGIDFTGGTMWQIQGQGKTILESGVVNDFFENKLNIKNLDVYSEVETRSVIIRLGNISEADHQKYLEALKTNFGDIKELRFEAIGPTIGKELRQKAIIAFILDLLGIAFYVAFAFRKVSYPVKSWKYGIIVLVTLFHDVVIPAGLFAVLNVLRGVEIDINFLVAALVIMGFSVSDTIVVFDRIRENILINRHRANLSCGELGEIINASVKQTMIRSLFTSFTLILVLLAMFFFGPVSLKYFVLMILVGTIVGTYSSIFVSSPLLYILNYRGVDKKA